MTDINVIDAYPPDTPDSEDFRPDGILTQPPKSLYIENTVKVQPVASDTVTFGTVFVPDSVDGQAPNIVNIATRRQDGVANKVTIHLLNNTGALGLVYLLKSPNDISFRTVNSIPHVPYGFYLGPAAFAAASLPPKLELLTQQDLYVVCFAAAAGVGALVSYSVESYYGNM